MGTTTKEIAITQGNSKVEVNLRKSTKAKHVAVRINHAKQVELVIPQNISTEHARKFLIKKQHWIFNKLKEIKTTPKFTISSTIPIFGVKHEIIHKISDDVISIKIENNSIKIKCPTDDVKEVLTEFLKSFFLKEVTKMANSVAKKMKLSFNEIRVTDATTRWGSCSPNKTLSFNWRLVFAPKEVVNYIVVHEISHLKEMNHSKAFWELVGSIDADFIFATKWLKKNSSALHSFLI